MGYDFDYLVIGGGSGGVRSSRIAAQLGARVALVESSALGGTCVNLGCVPKKLFSYAAEFEAGFSTARSYGWDIDVNGFDWAQLIDKKNKEIVRLNQIYQGVLEKAGVQVIRGHGRFRSAHEVDVLDPQTGKLSSTLSAKYILIATGGLPFVPDIKGKEHILVSDDLFFLQSLPKRALIYGSGYIALEFASIFAGLGVQVDVVYRGDRILKHFDHDVSQHLHDSLAGNGIHLHAQTEITEIKKSSDAKDASYRVLCLDKSKDPNKPGSLFETDLVIAATGRLPNTQRLNLSDIGVSTKENGSVIVNDQFQTEVPNIYALGDVIGRVALTPVAIREGANLANSLFGDLSGRKPLDYQNIPTAVFTRPQVSTVGLTQAQAESNGAEVVCYKSAFRPMKYSFYDSLSDGSHHNAPRTLMKMVVDAKSQRVLGLHMVGDDAAEMMQGLAVAVNMGATKTDFDAVIGIHPSSAEEWVTMN